MTKKETLDIIADSKLMKKIKKAKADMRKSGCMPLELVDKKLGVDIGHRREIYKRFR